MACYYLLRISIYGSRTSVETSWVDSATWVTALLVLQKAWLSAQHTFGFSCSFQQAICLYMTHCLPLRELEATRSSSSHYCRL